MAETNENVMTEPDNGKQPGGGEFQKVVHQRQVLKAERRHLQEQITKQEAAIASMEKQIADMPGGNLSAEAIENLKLKTLAAAAAVEGSNGPDTVGIILADRTIAAVDDAGSLELSFIDSDGPVKTEAGEIEHDARAFVRSYLAKPENENLVKMDARETLAAEREIKSQIAKYTEAPPKSMDALLALPPRVRDAVASQMTPEQRSTMLGDKPQKGYL